MGEQDRTGYAVNFAGKRRDHIANLDDRKMAEARARSEATRAAGPSSSPAWP